MNKYRSHTCGQLNETNIGQKVKLSGWVNRKRDHGNLVFIDLRDHYGITQCVIQNSDKNFGVVETLKPEYVVCIEGNVVARDASVINDKIPTGKIEIVIEDISILSTSETLPFQVSVEEKTAEDLRLKYRYLDLRREKLQRNMKIRDLVIRSMRKRMWDLGFNEFQTPILTSTSPEGARDFLVPSRMHEGKFYALPQAPQQYKQLSQIAGFDNYFQIAPCFRDEDTRADRVFEFYQLDIEMSFVEQEDIFAVGESVIPEIFKEFANGRTVDPNIPRISYDEVLEKYGTDKPDLRNPIIIKDASEIFKDSGFGVFASAVEKGQVVKAIIAPASSDKPRSWFDKLGEFAIEIGLKGLAYMVFTENEVKGPVAKNLDQERINKIKELCGASTGDSIFFVCENLEAAQKAAGKVRIRLGEDLNLIDKNDFKFCWVVDFPFFELDSETGTVGFCHNPFGLNQGGIEALKTQDPLTIKAYQYDMVCNGAEICSGGLRNFDQEAMKIAFAIAGYDEETVKTKFSALWLAFQYGPPPTAGCAYGVDRIVMMLSDEPNLREVILFPINQKGQDLMMNAPIEATEKQLRELHIKLRR